MKKRFYILKENIKDNKIILDGDEHQHLSKVLRMQVGDSVECFYDGSDIFSCTIEDINKKYSMLKIDSSYEPISNPQKNITLFQGLPKLDKLELITQKLVELGATTIIPFSSQFCIAKENLSKIDRLNKIVVSACKQCGRTQLLTVGKPIKFKEMVNMMNNYDLIIFANEKEDSYNFTELLSQLKESKNIAYIVGSEGGFSPEEIEVLSKITTSVSLGKRILRTETASIALCALISNLAGC